MENAIHISNVLTLSYKLYPKMRYCMTGCSDIVT